MTDDERFMAEAIVEAQKGMAEGEVPIGAVAVKDGVVIARGHNKRITLSDITAHAEIVCLRDLSARHQDHHGNLSFDLSDVAIYSTLEPCAMCLGAMIHYHIVRVVYGERDVLFGACGSKFAFHEKAYIKVSGGVLRCESRQPLLDFFEKELGHKSNKWMDIELPEE